MKNNKEKYRKIKIEDVLNCVSGDAHIKIIGIRDQKRYIMFDDVADRMLFWHIPCGKWEVGKIETSKESNTLVLTFVWPEMGKKKKAKFEKLAKRYSYTEEQAEKLYVKYPDFEYVEHLLNMGDHDRILEETEYLIDTFFKDKKNTKE